MIAVDPLAPVAEELLPEDMHADGPAELSDAERWEVIAKLAPLRSRWSDEEIFQAISDTTAELELAAKNAPPLPDPSTETGRPEQPPSELEEIQAEKQWLREQLGYLQTAYEQDERQLQIASWPGEERNYYLESIYSQAMAAVRARAKVLLDRLHEISPVALAAEQEGDVIALALASVPCPDHGPGCVITDQGDGWYLHDHREADRRRREQHARELQAAMAAATRTSYAGTTWHARAGDNRGPLTAAGLEREPMEPRTRAGRQRSAKRSAYLQRRAALARSYWHSPR